MIWRAVHYSSCFCTTVSFGKYFSIWFWMRVIFTKAHTSYIFSPCEKVGDWLSFLPLSNIMSEGYLSSVVLLVVILILICALLSIVLPEYVFSLFCAVLEIFCVSWGSWWQIWRKFVRGTYLNTSLRLGFVLLRQLRLRIAFCFSLALLFRR